MADVNVVTLTGRLVRDAEVSQKASGLTICNFSIANNYTKKTGETWSKEANFFELAIFGKTATTLLPFLKQGTLVAIDAELRQHRWEQDEKKRTSNEVMVKKVHLLSASVKKQVKSNDEIDSDINTDTPEVIDYPEDQETFQMDIF